MTKPRLPIIISDDIPSAYLRRLLGHRVDHDTAVFSRVDALRQAEAGNRRNANPKQSHPHGRPRRGRTVR
jgi:hypothetical protein